MKCAFWPLFKNKALLYNTECIYIPASENTIFSVMEDFVGSEIEMVLELPL